MEERETVPGSESPESKGALWRLQGIFFEPSATFEDINRKPGFVVPLIAAMVIGFLTWQVVGQFVSIEDLVITSIKISNPEVAERLTPDQLQQQAGISALFIQYAAPIIAVPIIVFLTAGIFMLLVWLTGAETTFSRVAAVTSHTFFLQGVIGAVLLILVFALSSDPLTINLENPVMTNPGPLLDAKDSPVLYRLASSLDIVVWYAIFLMGLGLSKVSRPMSTSTGVMLVAIPYVLYVGIRMALAAIF